MKKIAIPFLLILLISCQSKTYYSAQSANHKRFDGWNREDADFLMETHDLVLLIEGISSTAEDQASLKETYILAKEIKKTTEDLRLKFKLEAAVKRVKLSSALSEKSDQLVQKLSAISKENFDAVYLQYLQSNLEKSMSLADDYIKTGHTARLKTFANDLKNELRPLLEQIKKSDLS